MNRRKSTKDLTPGHGDIVLCIEYGERVELLRRFPGVRTVGVAPGATRGLHVHGKVFMTELASQHARAAAAIVELQAIARQCGASPEIHRLTVPMAGG
jgi:hypothetical protein